MKIIFKFLLIIFLSFFISSKDERNLDDTTGLNSSLDDANDAQSNS